MSMNNMAGMDPEESIFLLRNAISSNKTIQLFNAQTPVFDLPSSTTISFPSASTPSTTKSFPKLTQTRLMKPAASSEDVTYDLETLLYAVLNNALTAGEYMKKATQDGVKTVNLTDRKLVIDWLEGKSSLSSLQNRLKPNHTELPPTSTSSSSSSATSHPELKRPLPSTATTPFSNDAPVSSSTSAQPAAGVSPKKSRYIPDKADQDYVEKLLAIIDGPAYATGNSSGEQKLEKMGGVWKNRETVLRGDRNNVCFLESRDF